MTKQNLIEEYAGQIFELVREEVLPNGTVEVRLKFDKKGLIERNIVQHSERDLNFKLYDDIDAED